MHLLTANSDPIFANRRFSFTPSIGRSANIRGGFNFHLRVIPKPPQPLRSEALTSRPRKASPGQPLSIYSILSRTSRASPTRWPIFCGRGRGCSETAAQVKVQQICALTPYVRATVCEAIYACSPQYCRLQDSPMLPRATVQALQIIGAVACSL